MEPSSTPTPAIETFADGGAAEETRAAGGVDSDERKRILDALQKCAGNQTRAALLLGISRRTLVSRLATFDLPRPRKPRSSS
jgi:DNA-binding NtrC family response regulator